MKKQPTKNLTNDTPQVEVVTLALYRLRGAERAVDTEDIGVEAHRIAPGRFSWKKYPDQINLELIRVFLSDAKKTQNSLVIGSGRTGWRLTEKGLKWAEGVAQSMPESNLSRSREQSRSGSIDEQRRHRERTRVLKSRAWELWKKGNREIPLADAKDVFRVDSYAHGEMRVAKFTRLRSMFSDDPVLVPFLDHLIANLKIEPTDWIRQNV